MATINFTTFVDENDGGSGGTDLSLPEAIIQANSNGEADTINLAAEDCGDNNLMGNGDSVTLYQIYLLSRLLRSRSVPAGESHHGRSRKNVYWA